MPRIFVKSHTVQKDDIDDLGHVNNLVYMRWFVDVAVEHSTAQGWPEEAYLKRRAGFVVRRHEIDYLAPAMPNDQIEIRTWIASRTASSSNRRYEIVRLRDGKILTQGLTRWVWVDFTTGLPDRIPHEVASAFEIAGDKPDFTQAESRSSLC